MAGQGPLMNLLLRILGLAMTLTSVWLAHSEYCTMSLESEERNGHEQRVNVQPGTVMKFCHLDFPRLSVGPPLETG